MSISSRATTIRAQCRRLGAIRKLTLGVLLLASWYVSTPLSAETIDRVEATVGSMPITTSDVDLELRVSAMLNDSPYQPTEGNHKEALERLIDRRLIAGEIALAQFLRAEDESTNAAVEALRGSTFRGGVDFQTALAEYGLKDDDVWEFMREILTYRQYRAFRFETGLTVDDAEIRRRYAEVHGDPPRPGTPTLEQARDEIEEELRGPAADRLLLDRVKALRAETSIVVLPDIARPAEAAAEPAEAGRP